MTPRIMYYLLMLASIAVLAVSCSEKKEKPPVSLDEMQALLMDLHLAEAYSIGRYPDSLKNKFDKNTDSLAVFYTAVFKHHNMDADRFREIMDWYKSHPDMLDSLYNRVLDMANKMEAEQEQKEAGRNSRQLRGKDSAALKPAAGTSEVKRQRDSLRRNRRTFEQQDSLY